MSGNQKQAPTVVPQQQTRFPQGPFIPPRPPTPQRTDGFHVTTPPFVAQQPPNQGNNQGPTLRSMAPTGPPTQASTPPNTELKVQQMPQQASVNIAAYMPQAAQVRGTTTSYYGRPPPPPSQTPRMANHQRGQQALYPTQPMQFVQIPNMQHTMYNNLQFQFGQRPTGFVQQYQHLGGQPTIAASYAAYPQPQATPQMYTYTYPTQIAVTQRSGPPPQVPSAPPSHTQPTPPNMGLPQNSQQPGPQQKNKRRAKAIPIIDPNTGKDKLTEMFEQQDQDESHPPSGESSARQTPQPAVPNPSKEVQATFAKQVAQAISNDEAASHATIESDQPPSLEHLGHSMYPHSPPSHPPQAVQNSRLDQIVQSSTLKAQAKEFISQTAKETTPVVSALSDAVEVTITKPQPKDRESPIKSRKQRDQTPREHKEQPAPPKDAFVCEKPPPSNSTKEETKPKQETITATPVQNVQLPSTPVVAPNKENSISYPREEKKASKKEKVEKPENKAATTASTVNVLEPSSEIVPTTTSISAPPSDNTTVNAKSKHNASQKSKDVSKQSNPQSTNFPPTNTKPTQTSLPVPSTQPAKANNKSTKLRELNLKGSLKEGSDMDAFSDTISSNENTNNNSSNIANQKDTINVNNTVIIENSKNVNSIVNDTNKKTESNDAPTIKSETKSLPKGRIDVTDIVKDLPKPPSSKLSTPMECQDEPDRAFSVNDKLVQAKNKANKTVVEYNDVNNVIDTKNNSTYKEVPNIDGKKVYSRDFLISLRTAPKSKLKPENVMIPTELLANYDDRGRVGDISRYAVGGRGTTDFAPSFSSGTYSGRSSSQRGNMVPKRGSQSKQGGDGKGNKRTMIKVSISVKEDVKLHETENAWKPARFIAGANMTEEDKKTEQLYRKVRGILNKLTPQKFETLLSQIQSLTIDTCDRLQGVIDLVFEKAVDEPNFSVAYALLCKELALMQVPNSEELKKKDEYVNFRKLLVTRCQREFEKNSIDEEERNTKVREIDECTDPEKKKELQIELDEYDRRLRMKSVGNIRFIGELYKQQMLTSNIMVRCIVNLLEDKNEESLECLCKLLSTIGKELESKNVDLTPYFTHMKEIVDKKHGRISSRVRFMLQDVIDLRNAKWVPRRQDLNPKTIDQIQKEADSEHMSNQALNALPIPKRDDRGSSIGSDKKRRNVTDDSGWSTATSRNRPASFSVVSDKLKNKVPQPDEPLGSSHMFGNWIKGSNIKPGASTTNTNNMYAPLDTISDPDRTLGGIRANKDLYTSKPSLERYKQYDDGRGSRSGSQQRSRDSSTTSQRSTGTAAPPPIIAKVQLEPEPEANPEKNAPPELTGEQLERRLKNILEEYLNDCCTIKECDQDIKSSIPKSAHSQLVSEGCNSVLERSKTARMRTGELFVQLIKHETLSLEDYCIGLKEVLSAADDLTIDIPKIWDYLAEIIAPLICEEVMTFNVLHKCSELLISQGHMPKLMAPIFELIVQTAGANFLKNKWQESRMQLEDFMPKTDINKFISDKKLEFLLESGSSVLAHRSSLSFDQIREKLLSLFNADASFDDVAKWIETNIGEGKKENHFIRALMTAILEHSVVNMRLKDDVFKNYYNYLLKFADVTTSTEADLQCLYAVQALVNKWEHPQGLLLSIFEKLYDNGIIPHESFIAWEGGPPEQPDKGVALKQLTSFFTHLKEADDETESSASEEA